MYPPDLSQKAIDFALSGNWKEAIKVNLTLLKEHTKDIETLNRLGRAYLETGQKSKAEETYKKVLHLDKFNSIAAKNLGLLKTSRVSRQSRTNSISSMPLFLEELGVTKTITLIRLGDAKILARLHAGDQVNIVVRQHTVAAVSTNNEYLGRLPDDLAARLRPFIKAGNTYVAWIRSIDPFRIFAKENHRCAKFAHTPSFPITEKLTYAAFTPPELIHDEKPDTSATEEQEEALSLPIPEGESEEQQ